MSKVFGIFSILGSGFSVAIMWMQRAGHIVSHIMHATHRGDPSWRFMSRWRVLSLGAYPRCSSGYSIVTVCPLPTFKPKARTAWRGKFTRKCLAVMASPRATSVTYIRSKKPSGRCFISRISNSRYVNPNRRRICATFITSYKNNG